MTSKPLIVHCCHCTWCQRETGTGFALNAMIEADRVQLLTGEVAIIDVPSNSGKGQRISRCPKCLIAVWSNYAGAGDAMRFVRVGTLDQPAALPPDIHIFTSSKQPWVLLPPGTPAVLEYYKSTEVWSKESLERRAALKSKSAVDAGGNGMAATPQQGAAVRFPDLAARPFDLTVEHNSPSAPATLYEAWTRGLDRWFAAPGSVLMRPEVNAVFFFETEFKHESEAVVRRHPHYGRFLKLVENRLIELTWVTGAPGTEGAETVVTVELQPKGAGTAVRLRHAGFANAAARDGHLQAWPMVFEHLDASLAGKTRTV